MVEQARIIDRESSERPTPRRGGPGARIRRRLRKSSTRGPISCTASGRIRRANRRLFLHFSDKTIATSPKPPQVTASLLDCRGGFRRAGQRNGSCHSPRCVRSFTCVLKDHSTIEETLTNDDFE